MNDSEKDNNIENPDNSDEAIKPENQTGENGINPQKQESTQAEIENSILDERENSEQIDQEDSQKNAPEIIASLQEEVADLHDKLLRSFAESENIRNRSTKMVEESRLYSITAFAKDLLPVMDNFTRTLQHAPENPEGDLKVIIDGVSMTKTELENAFKKHGLECISPQKGEKFDYNKHNAISQIVTDEFQAGTIVDTMQVGYKIKDRLLRPAVVTVAK